MRINSAASLLLIYRLAASMAAPWVPLVLRRRVKEGKEDLSRLNERFGKASIIRPTGPLVWFHAASVGELFSLLTLMQLLPKNLPQFTSLVTTGTVTSAKLALDRLPSGAIHQYAPLDLSVPTRRFINYWKPSLAIRMESELWPIQLEEMRLSKIPTLLVNARISPQSQTRWLRASGLASHLLRTFEAIFAQSPEDATRYSSIAKCKVVYSGNLKAAAGPLPFNKDRLIALNKLISGRLIWVMASTHEGEELIAADAHKILKGSFPDILTDIVPRHPKRGSSISKKLREGGYKIGLRSEGTEPESDIDIYIDDSIGELGIWYRVASLVVVAGSLRPFGGHNPLEPAILRKPLIFGPNMDNFQSIADGLVREGGAIITSESALAADLCRLLGDDDSRLKIGMAALEYAQNQQILASRVGEAVAPWLQKIS